jgi:hypothetical protein
MQYIYMFNNRVNTAQDIDRKWVCLNEILKKIYIKINESFIIRKHSNSLKNLNIDL